MICEECGKKTKVCFLSDNSRYKIWICKGCKSKEKDSDNAESTNLGVEE